MARWSRSGLRNFGIAAIAVLGGTLLLVPAISSAAQTPAPARPPAAAVDRVETFGSAFAVKPASGAPSVPYSFVSTGGDVQVRRLGGDGSVLSAAAGAPVKAGPVKAAAATYPTTLTVDSEYWRAWYKFMYLWNRDTWAYVPVPYTPGTLSETLSLPPGNYYAAATYGAYKVDSYLLTKAFTVTSAAQTVHLAESSAKEVAVKPDDGTARLDNSAVWISLPNGDDVGDAGGQTTRTYVTTASTPGTTLHVHDVWTKEGTTAFTPSPYRYDLMKSWPHPLPASPIATAPTASLARTGTTILGQGFNADALYYSVPTGGEFSGPFLPTSVRVPTTITEYVTPGVPISGMVEFNGEQSLTPPARSLPAGTSPGRTIGAGPLVPGRQGDDYDSRRDVNDLRITEDMTLSDAAGNPGTDLSSSTSMTLSSGGRQLATSTGRGLTVTVPSERQTYQLQQTSARKAFWSQLSTRVSSEWTFASAGPTYGRLPLMDLAMTASGLDARNRSGAAPVQLTVTPSTRQTAAASAVDKVEWSADDGATWADLPITASGAAARVSLAVPAATAFVSLRVTASNAEGGTLRRTVIRALAGPAMPSGESVGGVRISRLVVNDGRPLVVGTPGVDEMPQFTAIFTVTGLSGVATAGLTLWHGDYYTPDGRLDTTARCATASVAGNTSICRATVYIADARWSLGGNPLAGAWQADVWAVGKNGAGLADQHAVGSVAIKRATALTVDATPEPVAKGKTITVVGALTRADWQNWAFGPYASRTVTLEYAKSGGAWTTVKTATTDPAGKLKTTVTATADGYYRWTFPGDAASDTVTSDSDYVDVQ